MRRAPTNEELNLLLNQNFNCQRLTIYEQCKKRKMLCRSVAHNKNADVDVKSDNSIIYTFDNQFYNIDSIVTFRFNGIAVCGIFGQKIWVGGILLGAPHLVEVIAERERRFVPISLVRNLAMKIRVLNKIYICPMANQSEID